jgi:Co/Zn/Cd efflux system component
MSAHCEHHTQTQDDTPRYRRILWIALVLNLLMFGVELISGIAAGSVSLLADAIDFFGDAANYAVSLAVLSMVLAVRAKAALFKAACMLAFGVFILGKAGWAASQATVPQEHMAPIMGLVGFVALCVNVFVAAMLYKFRNGDSNMQSVWLCSRNDALSNLAVMLAALGVFGTASVWPDLAVAAVMGLLAISSSAQVFATARHELKQGAAHAHQRD